MVPPLMSKIGSAANCCVPLASNRNTAKPIALTRSECRLESISVGTLVPSSRRNTLLLLWHRDCLILVVPVLSQRAISSCGDCSEAAEIGASESERNATKRDEIRRGIIGKPMAQMDGERLDSWKEIADYLGKNVRTVQLWEKNEGLPIRRLQHARQGAPYALKSELDEWRRTRESTAKRPQALSAKPSRRRLALGLVLCLLLIGLGVYTLNRWQFSRRRAMPVWERLAIETPEEGRKTVWGFSGADRERPVQWKDIAWNGRKGWLCGATIIGGGGGNVGTGVLLHTTDGGTSWSRIDQKIPGGKGAFPWGPRGTYQYQWEGVGPIYDLRVNPSVAHDGKLQIELWLAATTGVYYSHDGAETWERSTPRPDDAKHDLYAQFSSLFRIWDIGETYAVGWQGISHLSNNIWTLQVPTYSYFVTAVYAKPIDSVWQVWAVDSRGSIYHLDTAPKPSAQQSEWDEHKISAYGLQDVVMIDSDTVMAVGQKGTLLKGSRRGVIWSWEMLKSRPTGADLYSMAYADGTLWIVGADGVVLKTNDLGQSWAIRQLKDEFGSAPRLSRVRTFENSVWIVGSGVVYRRQ